MGFGNIPIFESSCTPFYNFQTLSGIVRILGGEVKEADGEREQNAV
jgi:hypothetical protein